jgi:hypothetical protein
MGDGPYVTALDSWRRCPTNGCDWHIPLWAERCMEHGGPKCLNYKTLAGGETYYTRIAVYSSGDAETDRPTPPHERGLLPMIPVIGLLIIVAVLAYAWGVANGRDEERKLHGWDVR